MAELTSITDGTAASDACGDLFRRDPVGCNRVTTGLRPGQPTELHRVHDGPETLGAAVGSTSGYTVTPLADGAAPLLGDVLPIDRRIRLVGAPGDIAAIAGRWSERCDGSIDTGRLFRAYRLDDPQPRKKRGGRTNVADRDSLDRAAAWSVAFAEEIGIPRTADGAAVQMADAINEHRLIEWVVQDDVVSQVTISAARFGVVRINGLYTPPELRKDGHSGTLAIEVAAQQMSRQKVDQVVVDVPAADGVLNRMYRRLGFESMFETLAVWLIPPRG